jgi:hypothetical protein
MRPIVEDLTPPVDLDRDHWRCVEGYRDRQAEGPAGGEDLGSSGGLDVEPLQEIRINVAFNRELLLELSRSLAN